MPPLRMFAQHATVIGMTGLILTVYFQACASQSPGCNSDLNCTDRLGEFSECWNGKCACADFYVLDQSEDVDRCIKVVQLGGACQHNVECQGSLGLDSICNKTYSTPRCECHSLTGDTHYLNGRCHVSRTLGDPCKNDDECAFGPGGGAENFLARCENATCVCLNNMELSLHSMEMAVPGICQVHCPDCEVINISILMSCLAGSLFLITFIYAMVAVARPLNSAIEA